MSADSYPRRRSFAEHVVIAALILLIALAGLCTISFYTDGFRTLHPPGGTSIVLIIGGPYLSVCFLALWLLLRGHPSFRSDKP
jgi:hypothetical protein